MKKTILCFGDSNTHGYNAENGGRFLEEERWCYILEKKLGNEYRVIEEGMSGRTTCFVDPLHESMDGISHIYSVLMTHEPVDLLVVMLGTNDTKERFNVGSEAIGISMERLIKKAISVSEAFRNNKPNILLVTPKNIEREYVNTEICKAMGYGCDKKSEGLHDAFKKVADNLNIYYFNANDVVKEYNKIDFMHLTQEGNRELAEGIYKKIIEIFE